MIWRVVDGGERAHRGQRLPRAGLRPAFPGIAGVVGRLHDERRGRRDFVRGRGVLSGAVVRDSARLVVGFEASRIETPFLRVWPQILRRANAGAFAAPQTLTRQTASGFAGFEWQLSANSHVSLRGDFAFYPEYDLTMVDVPSISLRPRVSGRDMGEGRAAIAFLGLLGERAAGGIRHEPPRVPYGRRDPAHAAGAFRRWVRHHPLFPGDFQQTRLDVSDALTFAASDNALKSAPRCRRLLRPDVPLRGIGRVSLRRTDAARAGRARSSKPSEPRRRRASTRRASDLPPGSMERRAGARRDRGGALRRREAAAVGRRYRPDLGGPDRSSNRPSRRL